MFAPLLRTFHAHQFKNPEIKEIDMNGVKCFSLKLSYTYWFAHAKDVSLTLQDGTRGFYGNHGVTFPNQILCVSVE